MIYFGFAFFMIFTFVCEWLCWVLLVLMLRLCVLLLCDLVVAVCLACYCCGCFNCWCLIVCLFDLGGYFGFWCCLLVCLSSVVLYTLFWLLFDFVVCLRCALLFVCYLFVVGLWDLRLMLLWLDSVGLLWSRFVCDCVWL